MELKDFKNNAALHEIGLALARSLISAGWRPRGKGSSLAFRDLTEEEKKKWHSWRLLYRPNVQERDFIGRRAEIEHIDKLIKILGTHM